MAINKNVKGVGKFIKAPGEYVVTVRECLQGLSKKQKPMLTVTFETDHGESIKGYFVRDLNFHMHNLGELKLACGIKKEQSAEYLIGKRCGILVEAEQGDGDRVNYNIAGYGLESSVENQPDTIGDFGAPHPADEIPF